MKSTKAFWQCTTAAFAQSHRQNVPSIRYRAWWISVTRSPFRLEDGLLIRYVIVWLCYVSVRACVRVVSRVGICVCVFALLYQAPPPRPTLPYQNDAMTCVTSSRLTL